MDRGLNLVSVLHTLDLLSALFTRAKTVYLIGDIWAVGGVSLTGVHAQTKCQVGRTRPERAGKSRVSTWKVCPNELATTTQVTSCKKREALGV